MAASIASKGERKSAPTIAHVQKPADGEMKERASRRKLRNSAPETALTAR
jgi:hypothetical protein